MPYIPQTGRATIDLPDSGKGLSVGELNFLITRLVLNFLGMRPGYASYNAAIGVLECAKLELYRRMVAPYEDTKIVENGDVYP